MPQVRILYKDGTRDDIDVESEDCVTASVIRGNVVVIEQPADGSEIAVIEVPVEDVKAVVTTPWSESDGPIDLEETTLWASPDA